MSKPTTQELYADLLTERQGVQKFHPGEIRLSEVGGCLRKASLRLLGKVGTKPDLTQESIFKSGDEHEEHIADLWRALYPRQVRRQVLVKSPFGTGHMDIWIAPLKHYVEAKSTKHKSIKYLPMQSHVDQVQLYLHYYIAKRGGTAEIAYRDKETGEILSFPVVYDAAYAEELVGRLQRLQDAKDLQLALPMPEGVSPDRFPCGWLRDGKLVACEFWHECWGVQGVTEEPTVLRLLDRYRETEAAVRSGKAATAEAEEEREGVRLALGMTMERLGTNVVHHDGYEVRRSATGRWTPRAMNEKGESA